MSYSIEELRNLVNSEKKQPKILIFDIETSPMVAYVWKRFKENISLDQTIQESFMICWSAKWLLEENIFGDCITAEEAMTGNDYRVVKSLYDTICEADIIVAYNGKTFDIPYMNQRFLVHNFDPYPPVQIVDPYETAKYTFRFSSNKMDHIATEMGLSNKISTDFNLWRGCMEGDQKSLDNMFTYNKQDVKVLEEIYYYMVPWIKKHPILNSYLEEDGCIKCGNKSIKKLNKFYYTPCGKYELFKCMDCGAIFRGKKNLLERKSPFMDCKY